MAKNKIGIRNIAQIGVADIDVYGTKRKLLDNTIPKNAEKVKLRIGVFFDGTGNNGYNSDAVYYNQSLPIDETQNLKIKHNGFEVKGNSSYLNRYSNVKLLYDLYENKGKDNLDDKNDPHHYLQLKVYMQGIGTLQDEDDDTLGTGFGEGDRGVIGRVEQACADIAKQIEEEFNNIKNKKVAPFKVSSGKIIDAIPNLEKQFSTNTAIKTLFIESIQFDVFGFSRGAAAARHFCNEVLKQKTIYNNVTLKQDKLPLKQDKVFKDYYLIEKDALKSKKNNLYMPSRVEFTGGKLGEELKAKKKNYPLKSVTVEFLGLFDTVIAQFLEKKGIIDFAKNNSLMPTLLNINPILQTVGVIGLKKIGQIPKVNPDVSHPNIKKVFQLHASNEWRENFALTPIINYGYGSSLRVLGAHSDVGGGYWNTQKEINILHFFDIKLNANATDINKANTFKQLLRQWYIDNKFCSEDNIFWETMHHVQIFRPQTIPGISVNVYDTALIKETILGDQIEKIIDGKKHVLVGYHYRLKSERKLNNKLSLVYMNVMKHMATKFADVPFLETENKTLKINHPEEYKFDENYDLSKIYLADIKESYQDMMIKIAEHGWAKKDEKPIEHNDLVYKENSIQKYKIPASLYEDIKEHYVHLSANFNKPIPYLEILSEYQFVYPSVPNFTFDKDFKNPPYAREIL